ncbi:MAG: transcription repressor NadR [Firmicutes bacterium]|nr:transcription repressor NadR [Bacillota bacterium]
MSGEERLEKIFNTIRESKEPISANSLAAKYGVSRQVIVQDIALLKAGGSDIISTNKGYTMHYTAAYTMVVKVWHTDEQIEDELQTIVDLGGRVLDVFVWHRAFGRINAAMNVKSRRDIKKLIESFTTGKSKPLSNVTSGYHYHTIEADNGETLEEIKRALDEKNYTAPEI